ncbi:N-acetylmuramidase domain-containing protein [Methylotuvimicrobium sp.]|uniref:N-acetylmuramidase domain-containing protein n=1 Tax=Methylotuvimicrobium sp. TaxID=2822413 RepID=UPI003D65EC49
MTITTLMNDARIGRIIADANDHDDQWRDDLQRFLNGDASLTRASAGESGIKAIQRVLIFLGYSTTSTGAFTIDGDFGRGTNRAVAQFQFEHGLNPAISRKTICYECRWNTARTLITVIPDAKLTLTTLEKMLKAALDRIDAGHIMTGRFDDAIFHLNALHKRRFLDCRGILDRYGEMAQQASKQIEQEKGVAVRPEWILAIIRQETAGVIRPRFEQHYLSRLNKQHPDAPLEELRMQSMSLGLGQIMGANFKMVGAKSATELFTAPAEQQVAFVARFLTGRKDAVKKTKPEEADFRSVARYYNGPKYEAHHYHEQLARWHREFKALMQ